jgi:Na+/proline symporter
MNEGFQQSETIDKLEGLVKPMIYSKRAIWGFSVFFTPLFGGILLMQNLKDIDKRKEANLVVIISIIMMVATIFITIFSGIKNTSTSLICNICGASVLTEYFYRKYFPDQADYDKKKIWKPLIIGVSICVALFLFAFMGRYQTGQ